MCIQKTHTKQQSKPWILTFTFLLLRSFLHSLPNLLSATMESYPDIEATLNKCGMPIVPSGHRCVAIVDPPRGGLHPKVTKALRKCTAIDTLIYVSCNPFGSFVEDALRLCLPENDPSKKLRYGKHCSGKPFVPLRAAPVDMFPDTRHCGKHFVLFCFWYDLSTLFF